MKSKSATFQLALEVLDDFIDSNKPRCIHCLTIVNPDTEGCVCDSCYSQYTIAQLMDLDDE